MAQPVLAVDTPSLLYRAFFALPDSITDSDGVSVNALLGATNLILAEIEEYNPRAVVLCFGAEAAAYRKKLLPVYHADRPEMPEKLVPQWERAKPFFEGFGWTVRRHATLEADDLLGTLAKLETEAGGDALLLTGDRDMFQCASKQVTVLYLR
ncbi:MAG: DNA polymerase I, partial [Actinomycetota bacterium]|nr:DNA polymerase I [Actinomycetota bacterium]